ARRPSCSTTDGPGRGGAASLPAGLRLVVDPPAGGGPGAADHAPGLQREVERVGPGLDLDLELRAPVVLVGDHLLGLVDLRARVVGVRDLLAGLLEPVDLDAVRSRLEAARRVD